jgi:hypothetical protein
MLALTPQIAEVSAMKKRLAVGLILVFFVSASAFRVSPQPSKPAEIPLRVTHVFGLMLVTVEINGKPAVLILDTGSNHTIVSSRFVDVATPPLKDTVTTERGSGLSGRGVFTRASLKVGQVLLLDHPVLAMDMKEMSKSFGENIDGLLGMDFLQEFERVVLDLRQHKLILSDRVLSPPST